MNQIECPYCHRPTAFDSVYCTHCRVRLSTLECRRCSHFNPPGALFCVNCRQRLRALERRRVIPLSRLTEPAHPKRSWWAFWRRSNP